MSKSKSNIKNMLCLAGFLAVFAMSFVVLSYAFAGHGQSAELGMEKRISYAYRGEAADSIDVVFLGNSDIYRGMSPVDLYHNTGISSVVVGNPGVGIDKMYESMEDMFEYQHPKVVVLETDCFFSSGNYKTQKITSTLSSEEMLDTTKDNAFVKRYKQAKQFFKAGDDAILTGLNYLYPLVKYHDNWKHMTFNKIFKGYQNYFKFSNKGMVYSNAIKPLDDSQIDYMNINRKKAVFSNRNEELRRTSI